MEEQQEQNQEEQPEVAEEAKKKSIPTCLGSFIIFTFALLAGAGVWWYADSYTPPETVDVSETITQIQERREVKNELPKEYEIKADGVYYLGELIEGADPETFEYVENVYTKDANNVFYFDKLIEGADPKTFEFVCYLYTKDKNNVYDWIDRLEYYEGYMIPVEVVDPDTFEVIMCDYDRNRYCPVFTKDKNNVYIGGCEIGTKILKLADPETFQVIETSYKKSLMKDKDQLFYFSLKKERSSNLYPFLDLYPEVDTISLELLSNEYIKDKNHVYFFNKDNGAFTIIEGTDPVNCTAENIDGCKGS